MLGRRVSSRPFLGSEAHKTTKFLAEGIGPRVAGSDAERAAAEYILGSFRSMGYRTSLQSFRTPNETESQNIIACAGDLPERFIVVGAHYDSVTETPGANDNASGVGVLLETALCLAGIELPMPVVYVAFGSEEGPHAGSKHFVETLASRDVVLGMINLDAVGVDAGMEIGCYGEVDPWLANHCRGVAEWLGYTLSECNFGGKSDYASFSDAGIPVACFARTDQSSAHTPDDTMEIISADGLAQIGEVLVASIVNLPARRMKRR